MTILNVRLARAIWLVDSRDLNPHGIDMLPILEAVKGRYSFKVSPTKMEDANENDPKGIVFMNGSFLTGSGRHTIVKATIYGDGIVVDSALSTDFCEAFLSDVLGFLASQFGLTYRPDMVHTRLYVSELIVHTDKNLDGLFGRLAAFTEKLRLNTGRNFQPAGFGFSIDPGKTTARPSAFRFEREVGKPFSHNRYYSSAPTRTSQHEELLREIENLL